MPLRLRVSDSVSVEGILRTQTRQTQSSNFGRRSSHLYSFPPLIFAVRPTYCYGFNPSQINAGNYSALSFSCFHPSHPSSAFSAALHAHFFPFLFFVCTSHLTIHSEINDEEWLFQWPFFSLLLDFTSNYCTEVIWGLDEKKCAILTFTILTFKINLLHPGCISSSTSYNMSWVFDRVLSPHTSP